MLSTWTYRARDPRGEAVTGSLSAPTAEEAVSRLRAEGMTVTAMGSDALREPKTDLDLDHVRLQENAHRIARPEVVAFCQQVSVMLDTGVPLTEALEAFAQQTPSRAMAGVVGSIVEDLCGGDPFSTALARWPHVFPTVLVSLMRASEASGTMAGMLDRVGEYLATEQRTAGRIRGAMSYPLFMMVLALLLTGFLVTFILPRFARIYEIRASTLPTPTRVLMSVSEFVTTQWPIYIPSLAILAVGIACWLRTNGGRHALDWIRLRAPVLRWLYERLYITRAARTMATLLSAGVGLLDVIRICRGVTNNVLYDVLWDDMEAKVRDGMPLSDSVRTCAFIPPHVASMIASGERAGRLPAVMDRVASFSEEELDLAVSRLTALVEPVMVILMGFLVGGVAAALLLPIFNMSRVVAGG